MLILGLLGMYFDAAVVFVTKSSLFFKLAVAILWLVKFSILFSCWCTVMRKVSFSFRNFSFFSSKTLFFLVSSSRLLLNLCILSARISFIGFSSGGNVGGGGGGIRGPYSGFWSLMISWDGLAPNIYLKKIIHGIFFSKTW